MKWFSILLAISLTGSPLAMAWDPDDETFDPTIQTVIADGSTRLGDPSPVYQEGVEVRGFTHVGFTRSPEGVVSINVSLIVPVVTDDPAKHPMAGLFLSVEEAEKLADALEEADGFKKELSVQKTEGMGNWTLEWDGEKFLRLTNDHADRGATFLLSSPASKKLAGAVRHFIEASRK
ncbi:MAG: hypothetical protein AAGC68_00290 [Verrucomicrobiota bacterium]